MIAYKGITFAFDKRQLKRHLLYMFARRMGLKYAARRNYKIKQMTFCNAISIHYFNQP